jgi:hypothetical protein
MIYGQTLSFWIDTFEVECQLANYIHMIQVVTLDEGIDFEIPNLKECV